MNPKRFTVTEYEELARHGILTEDDHVELLDGLIVAKGIKTPAHDSRIDLLWYLLTDMVPPHWFVGNQNCIVTADSVPEPDLAVVRGVPGDYCQHHPRPDDVGLIVEIDDASMNQSRRKATIYARAGIPEYWIVNLEDRQIEVYSQPRGRGAKRAYPVPEVHKGSAELKLILDGDSVGTLSAKQILG